MATAREILELIITGNGQGAIAEMDRVSAKSKTSLGATERGLDALGDKALRFGVYATGAGAVAAAGLYSVAQDAGQLDSNLGRIRGTFGDAADSAIAFTKDANGIGLSDVAASSAVASIGQLSSSLGLASGEAARFTTESVSMVAQLAALNNASPVDGLEALRSALVGEYDPIQKLVPTITAASIEQRAMADSGRDNAKSLTQAEKATATFEIVLESAGKQLEAVGGKVENSTMKNARLASSWEDIKTSIGKEALPAVNSFVSGATDALKVVQTLDDSLGGIPARFIVVATGATLVTGSLALMSAGVSKTNAALRTSEGALNRWGKAAGFAATAISALVAADLAVSGIASAMGSDRKIADELNDVTAAAGNGKEALRQFYELAYEETAKPKFHDFLVFPSSELRIGGQKNLKISPDFNAELPQAEVQAAFDKIRAASTARASEVLAAFETENEAIDHNSRKYADNKAFIDRNRASIDKATAASSAQADAANDSADANRDAGSAAEAASRGLDKAAYSWRNGGDAASQSKSDILMYADALNDAFDPVLNLMDANDRLTDAQKRMADAANTNGRDVVDATRDLADAQANLNKVMRDDPLMGLRQVSPEADLADARTRLADANRRLAANPRDAEALTDRDTAVSDMEAASKRAQDLKRQGEQRADAIKTAQRQVSDAQQRLNEVQSQHGFNSEEYQRASREVIRANLDVQNADAQLAEYLRVNGIAAVGELKTKIDELIAQGGPVGAAAAQMKAALDPVVGQVLLFMAGMTGVNDQLDRFSAAGVDLNLMGAAGAYAMNGPDKPKPGPGKRAIEEIYRGGWIPGGMTGFSSGGTVPGSGFRDTVPAMLTPGEEVLDRNEAAIYRAARRASGTAAKPRRYVLANSSPSTTNNTSTREGDVTINTQISMRVDDPAMAGAAVQSALSDIAWRSGRGIRAGSRLGL